MRYFNNFDTLSTVKVIFLNHLFNISNPYNDIDIPTSCSPAWYSSSAMDRSYNLYLFSLGFLLPLSLLLSSSAAALTAIKTVSFFRNLTIHLVIWYSKWVLNQLTIFQVEGKFNEKTKNTM